MPLAANLWTVLLVVVALGFLFLLVAHRRWEWKTACPACFHEHALRRTRERRGGRYLSGLGVEAKWHCDDCGHEVWRERNA